MSTGDGEQETDQDWSWSDEESDWVPPTIDTSKPSVARIYDYVLGGKDNYAVDREAAEAVLKVMPDGREGVRANRAFMTQAVRTMARAGIRQFLDLGTGIPTSPNVHETAREVHPGARAVYVDNDPIVLSHNRAMLATDPGVITILQDLRDPVAVLKDRQLRALLDLSQPVGLLTVAVLHFIDLTSAPRIMDRYVRDLPDGSHVAISAACRDGVDPEVIATAEAVYANTGSPVVYRTRAQIEQLFDGLDLLEPGVFDCHRSSTARVMCGIAVKRSG